MAIEDAYVQKLEREDLQAISREGIERVLTEQCTVYVSFVVSALVYQCALHNAGR